LLAIGRRDTLIASLAGFSRAISEVGVILLAAGNIAG
jgi:ABC-type tungstate transport system substrate-binding protein